MNKFAKIFEDTDGNQLLLQVVSSDKELENSNDSAAGFKYTFEQEGAFVNITIDPMTYDHAEAMLEAFDKVKADKILEEGIEYFTKLFKQ